MLKKSDNMRKMKIAAMLIAMMIVGLTATSISGAEDFEGEINVDVSSFIGLVSPIIFGENQTFDFEVNVSEPVTEPVWNWSYIVDDELVISLNITDGSGRESIPFLLPRFVFYRVVMMRDISAAIAMNKTAMNKTIPILDRILPVRVGLKAVNVVDTLAGEKAVNITIPLTYTLDSDTYLAGGENLTMYITVMGFLPGNTNGFSEDVPIIDRKELTATITYVDNEA